MPHSELLFPLDNANFTGLEVSSERTEPLFWLCEIRFLTKFSCELECEIRRIRFRKGLNIIWAMPPKEFHQHDEQRIAGHATGKTTLCRMLRYLLGEANYGNDQLRNSIYQKFQDGYVVGHFRLNRTDWCVARPFAGHHGYALQTDSIDDFLQRETKKDRYETFKDNLSSLLGEMTSINKLPGQLDLTFHHLLPLFSRDQDSQYTKLAEWRDNSLSESAAPVLAQQSAMLVMRSLISSIVGKESELLAQRDTLAEKARNMKSHHDMLKYILFADRKRLREICHDNAEDEAMDELYVTTKVDECKRRLSSYCVDLVDELEYQRLLKERDDALVEYQQSAEQYNASLRKYKQDRREFNELKKESQIPEKIFTEEELDEIQIAAQQHPTRKYCCVPMVVAREHHCPWAAQYTKPEDTASKENLLHAPAVFQDDLGDRVLELKKYHQFLQEERGRVLELQQKSESAEKAFKNFCTDANSKRNQRAAEEGNKLEAIYRYQGDRQDFEDTTGKLNQVKEQLKDFNAQISEYRKETTLVAGDFSMLYDRVIRFVLGSQVVGRVKLNDGNIKLETSYHSADLQSAALDAVKNICFDIATMVYSVMGRGTHPRFLMHDGPRVSDVTRSIYLGYFNLMRDIEIASHENPNFQYIITTTEPPPEELQTAPWLICKLDATDTQSRLLKCNLE